MNKNHQIGITNNTKRLTTPTPTPITFIFFIYQYLSIVPATEHIVLLFGTATYAVGLANLMSQV